MVLKRSILFRTCQDYCFRAIERQGIRLMFDMLKSKSSWKPKFESGIHANSANFSTQIRDEFLLSHGSHELLFDISLCDG